MLIDDLSFSLPPAGIVGIIGPNGAGKTTLFRMLVGQEQPDAGTITIGSTVQLSYVDQSRDDLDPDKTVYEEITDGVEHMKVGNREIHGRAYCASFNFKGTDQQKPVGKLSGGERNRVHLAKLLKSGGNVLLLDEPTNDLDVDTLRALEAGLESFPGCAVVISHDRWFLDRIATHVLAFEGDSVVRWFEGNFTRIRGVQEARAGRKHRPAAPHQVQEVRLRAERGERAMDMNEFNRGVIEEFRSSAGQVAGNFEGWPMILVNHVGAKSGKAYTTPLVYTRDGDDFVVIASKGGAPDDPQWFRNLVANPNITIEVGDQTSRSPPMSPREPNAIGCTGPKPT